jgi:hypothetical protein
VLGATEKLTVALPLPLEADVSAIHETLDIAFQVHVELEAVTVIEYEPPSVGVLTFVGATVNVHGDVAPPCVTATDWPAIVNLPERAALEGLGAAVNCTLPAPFPDAPPTMVSHPSALDAVHSQASEAVTLTEAAPPSGGTVTAVLDSTKVHSGGIGGVPSAAD